MTTECAFAPDPVNEEWCATCRRPRADHAPQPTRGEALLGPGEFLADGQVGHDGTGLLPSPSGADDVEALVLDYGRACMEQDGEHLDSTRTALLAAIRDREERARREGRKDGVKSLRSLALEYAQLAGRNMTYEMERPHDLLDPNPERFSWKARESQYVRWPARFASRLWRAVRALSEREEG